MTELLFAISILLLILVCVLAYFLNIFYKKLYLSAEQTDILLQELDSFLIHLNKMNTSDLFFGEPLIVSLVNHSKYLNNVILTYMEIFSFMKSDKESIPIEETTNTEEEQQ